MATTTMATNMIAVNWQCGTISRHRQQQTLKPHARTTICRASLDLVQFFEAKHNRGRHAMKDICWATCCVTCCSRCCLTVLLLVVVLVVSVVLGDVRLGNCCCCCCYFRRWFVSAFEPLVGFDVHYAMLSLWFYVFPRWPLLMLQLSVKWLLYFYVFFVIILVLKIVATTIAQKVASKISFDSRRTWLKWLVL